jgi:hypothetical protein
MKNVIISILALSGMAVFAGCHKSSSGPSTTASVMFVHGCAAGTAAVVLNGEINGTIVGGAANLSFLSNSGYGTVTQGNGLNLVFAVSGLSPLDSQTVSITAGNHYSAFASGSITAPTICFTADDLTAPAAGYAKVRFANLSSDKFTTTCFAGSSELDSTLAYNQCSPYFQVAAGTLKIGMYDQSNPNNSGVITNQSLMAGKIYTFMLTGTFSATIGTSVLTLTAIINK